MPMYRINFDVYKEEFINTLNVMCYDSDNTLLTSKEFPSSVVSIVKSSMSVTFNGNRYVYINRDIFYDDFYKIEVSIGNTKLDKKDFDFDIETKTVSISYKIPITPNEVITVEYYKKCASVEIEASKKPSYVKIIPSYNRSYLLGEHTIAK